MVTVVVGLYGDRHGPFARVLVASLQRWPARVVLVHTDADVAWAPASVRLVPSPDILDEGRTARVAHKLLAWARGLEVVEDGARVVFLDADTMVERNPAALFDGQPFDVAHTWRVGRRWPINTGVVAARVSPLVRRWIGDWTRLVEFVLGDPILVQAAVDGWGAPDQAALVASLALDGGHEGLVVRRLDATVWNEEWPEAPNPRPAIWHLKGLLPVLMGEAGLPADDPRAPGVARWKDLYASLASTP